MKSYCIETHHKHSYSRYNFIGVLDDVTDEEGTKFVEDACAEALRLTRWLQNSPFSYAPSYTAERLEREYDLYLSSLLAHTEGSHLGGDRKPGEDPPT